MFTKAKLLAIALGGFSCSALQERRMPRIGTAAAIVRSPMNNANWIAPSSATVTGATRLRTTGASSIDSTLAAGIATATAEPANWVGRSKSGLDSPAAQIQAPIQAGEKPL
jgi:hypothetical protein